jgi:hypothetical protein
VQLELIEEERGHIPLAEQIMENAAPHVERMADELKNARVRLDSLLRHVGAPGTCKGCRAPILWVRHSATSGKAVPYDYNGEIHFASCEHAEQFRTHKEK